MNRQQAVAAVLEALPESAFLITTTGLISREVFAQSDRERTLYLLGSMGLASSIGLGLARLHPGEHIVVLDGDGSALMSLGVIPSIAAERPAHFTHLILDNEAYESTGAQPSISSAFQLDQVAATSGYAFTASVAGESELCAAIKCAIGVAGPTMVVAKVTLDPGLRTPPRVSLSPAALRDRFRGALTSGIDTGALK